jgi:putative tricarboxylic transport membrane protein
VAVKPENRAAFSTRSAELAVAGLILALAVLMLFESARIGARWVEDGPQTGYFPFYVALILAAASIVNILFALRIPRERNVTFVQVGQLKLVLSVLLPSVVFVAVVPWAGLYVAATLFIAYFMRSLGQYVWWKAAATSVGTGVTLFLLFEIWFLVPLPKGPLERLLGVG